MLRVMIDQLPREQQTLLSAAQAPVVDRNPANPVAITTTTNFDLKLATQGPDGTVSAFDTPENCVAIFGLSEELIGGEVRINTWDGAAWSATALTASIGGDRVWIPTDGPSRMSSSRYSDRIRVTIDPPALTIGRLPFTTGYVGEIAVGLLEQFRLNYSYGNTHQQQTVITTQRTVGGVEYRYLRNEALRNTHQLTWEGSADEQQRENMRTLYKATHGGLVPLVVIPDDCQRSGPESCIYAYLDSNFAVVEQFITQKTVALQLTEAVAYERPSTVNQGV